MSRKFKRDLPAIFLAGLVGEGLFEAYAWGVSPHIFGNPLTPSKLVMAITDKTFGLELSHAAALAVHIFIGSIIFALGVYIFHRVTRLNLWLSGALTGLILWFVAQGLLAPYIGRSFMMGFGPYTQSSFIGHVGMCLVIAGVLKWRFNAKA